MRSSAAGGEGVRTQREVEMNKVATFFPLNKDGGAGMRSDSAVRGRSCPDGDGEHLPTLLGSD